MKKSRCYKAVDGDGNILACSIQENAKKAEEDLNKILRSQSVPTYIRWLHDGKQMEVGLTVVTYENMSEVRVAVGDDREPGAGYINQDR